jgi:putative SOS response-associated peptidase YedK
VLTNARSETVATKPAFRTAFKKRRCLVPADGFIEWKADGRKKLPHLFTVQDGGLFAIAGLWESWERDGQRAETACFLTTEANGVVSPAHDRMPLILPREAWPAWLNPATDLGLLQDLLRPYPANEMEALPVSDVVNNARNKGPQCLEPAGQATAAQLSLL